MHVVGFKPTNGGNIYFMVDPPCLIRAMRLSFSPHMLIAHPLGFEPRTYELTARHSTAELWMNVVGTVRLELTFDVIATYQLQVYCI